MVIHNNEAIVLESKPWWLPIVTRLAVDMPATLFAGYLLFIVVGDLRSDLRLIKDEIRTLNITLQLKSNGNPPPK